MSHKKAKRIRAQIKYNPNKEKHQYQQSKDGQIICHGESKRALYLEMKKEV